MDQLVVAVLELRVALDVPDVEVGEMVELRLRDLIFLGLEKI